jgi:cytochrome P450
MRELTFEVILRAVLPPVTEIAGVTMIPFAWPQLGKVWPWSRWVRARERADAVLYDEIARRRADPGLAARRDVLSLLLQAGAMDDAEVRCGPPIPRRSARSCGTSRSCRPGARASSPTV